MKFLRFEDLQQYGITWSRVHLDRLQKAGQFPKKIKLGPNTAAYLESEIVAWIEARCADREGTARA
jgi:prophage regulatory protein